MSRPWPPVITSGRSMYSLLSMAPPSVALVVSKAGGAPLTVMVSLSEPNCMVMLSPATCMASMTTSPWTYFWKPEAVAVTV